MKRGIGVLVALSMLVLSSVACCFSFPGNVVRGSGNIIEAVRDTGSFDQVSVSGGIDLVLTQGDEEKVRIDMLRRFGYYQPTGSGRLHCRLPFHAGGLVSRFGNLLDWRYGSR